MSDSSDPDLRDVFRLLYDGDDWETASDEDDHPPLDAIAPELEVELVEEDVSVGEGLSDRYTKKRIFATLDTLFNPELSAKRRRIYAIPKPTSLIYTSSQPIPTLPNPTIYAPFSPLSLLSRLRTFQPSSFSPSHPSSFSPLTLALNGWINHGREALKCGRCDQTWSLEGLIEIRDDKVRLGVARRLAAGLRERHAEGCAWRVRSSPDGLYRSIRERLHPALSSSMALLAERLEQECSGGGTGGLRWSSPLGEKHLKNLLTSLSRYLPSTPDAPNTEASITAQAMAFFAWYPYHPNASSTHIDPNVPPRRTEIVQCRICERRVGLWSFRAPTRTFDLVDEHLNWCPIRRTEEDKPWWETCSILRPPRAGLIWEDEGGVERVLIFSDKLAKKPWRRK